METIIISNDNIEAVYEILHEMFNNQSTWKEDECVGFPVVHKISEGPIFGKRINVDTKYGSVVNFAVGDKVDVFDNHVILHEDNDFINHMRKKFPNMGLLSNKLERKPLDSYLYEKYIIKCFIWDIYYAFNANVEFGKGMMDDGYGDYPAERISKDEDICYGIIDQIKESLNSIPYPLPSIIELNIKEGDISVNIVINWKRYIDTAEIDVTYQFQNKTYEDLIEIFFKL